MKCPFCSFHDTKVIDSRNRDDGRSIRRRRECIKCNRRFTTRETVDEIPLRIIKQDGSREEFSRQKLMSGIQFACKKRPVSSAAIEQIVSKIEYSLRDRGHDEIPSQQVGELVMDELRELDDVAYVRFASVYRNFQSKDDFSTEV